MRICVVCVRTHACVCVCLCVCVFVNVYVYVHVCMSLYVCLYIYILVDEHFSKGFFAAIKIWSTGTYHCGN